MLTIASNAGHCLWSGIVPPERAKKVVEHLMAPICGPDGHSYSFRR